jgi:CubicO group peptidase (beta-lactamase class C family)
LPAVWRRSCRRRRRPNRYAAAEKALADSGAPSVSIAVVKDGRIAYVKAYGNARLGPATAAQPEMRYSIGSVSKQFMAAAILMLVEEGKLSLDDKVGRYLPSLTRANEVTIRQLLSHTSGYQDYYPLDYVAPFMQKTVTADEILKTWAGKPLDFDPGTELAVQQYELCGGRPHPGARDRPSAHGVSASADFRPAGHVQRHRPG